MLINRTALCDDCEKNNKCFSHESKQHYTDETDHELE